MSARVTVLGSCNTDMVVRLPHLPVPGETVLGGTFAMVQGGKGANQAVAAARAGGTVAFIGRVGDDAFGVQARAALGNEEIDMQFLATDPGFPSGVALIVVDARGENSIAVAPGANGNVTPEDVRRAQAVIASSDILVAQLEVPLESIRAAILIAASAGVPIVLNPAPALPLDDGLLRNVGIITPNEHEAALLTGAAVGDDAGVMHAAEAIRRRGVGTVIVTLGARGVYFTDGTQKEWIPSFPVNAVDTTAAGDVFTGAFAVALAERQPPLEACRFACAAAAISVTRPGAQPSAPRRAEIDALLHTQTNPSDGTGH
jgi:ribokinase